MGLDRGVTPRHTPCMKTGGRLTYSNIVSTLALVIATSTGGAYAASMITTAQIADGAVTTPKLHAEAVTTGKLRDDAVSRAKIAANAVNGAHVADGSIKAPDIANGSIGPADLALNAERPSAYGKVAADASYVYGGYNITVSKISRVTDPSEDPNTEDGYYDGVYCISDLSFTPRAVAATAALRAGGPGTVTADIGPGGWCPPGTDVSVRTFQVLGPSLTASDVSFNIVLWP